MIRQSAWQPVPYTASLARLLARYGERLVCVRYRYDKKTGRPCTSSRGMPETSRIPVAALGVCLRGRTMLPDGRLDPDARRKACPGMSG